MFCYYCYLDHLMHSQKNGIFSKKTLCIAAAKLRGWAWPLYQKYLEKSESGIHEVLTRIISDWNEKEARARHAKEIKNQALTLLRRLYARGQRIAIRYWYLTSRELQNNIGLKKTQENS